MIRQVDEPKKECPIQVLCQEQVFKKLANQDVVNQRLGHKLDILEEKMSSLQSFGSDLKVLIENLGQEFKEERKQNRETIKAITDALDRNENLQNERHEKTLDVQQRNLDANLSLLEIFQTHQAKVAELDTKIKGNSVPQKALMGLGIGLFVLISGFISSMVFPAVDSAFHAASQTFLKMLPFHW